MNKKIDFSYLLPSNITLDEYVKADVLPSDIEVTPLIPLRDLNRKEIKTIAQAAAGDETASTYLNNRWTAPDAGTRGRNRYFTRQYNKERRRLAEEASRTEAERQVAEMMSNNDWFYRSIGGGKPEHPASVHGREYTQPLVDFAVWGIGGAMGAANPVTSTLMTDAVLPSAGHVAKVMMNPATAETTVGAMAATAADAAGITYGLHRNSELIDNWWNGQFQWSDIPEFGLNLFGAVPAVNATMGAVDKTNDLVSYLNKLQNANKAMKSSAQIADNLDDVPTTRVWAESAPSNPMRIQTESAPNPAPISGSKKAMNRENLNKILTWRLSKGIPADAPLSIDDLKGYINELGSNGVISQADLNLKKTFNEWIDNLITTTTYHRALSPTEIVKQFKYMSQNPIPVTDQLSDVQEFFQHHSLPRVLKAIEDYGIQLRPEDLNEITRIYSNPFDGVNIKIGYTPPGWVGFSRGTDMIRYSNRSYSTPLDIDPSTIVHETYHSLRAKLGNILKKYNPNISESVLSTLQSGDPSRNFYTKHRFLPNEIDKMSPMRMSPQYVGDKSPAEEISAVLSGEESFKVWNNLRQSLGRIPTVDETNQAIDLISNQHILNGARSYGNQIGSAARDYEHWLEKMSDPIQYAISSLQQGKLPLHPLHNYRSLQKTKKEHVSEYIKAWKDMLKYVGGIGAGMVGTQSLQNSDLETNNTY